MYDFHFGNSTQIKNKPEEFLIFVKRLLPRWINGIPDSECLAIYRTLTSIEKSKPIFVETGCGASTLALFLYAALNGGHLYSWDTNGSKGSFLRSVISESICRPLNINLYSFWTFIGFDSTSEHIGIPVLAELGCKADFGFFDSWHTLNHLFEEIKCFERIADKKFIISLDDAFYQKRFNNYSYLNILRAKLDLNQVEEPNKNICEPFYVEVENYLTKKYDYVQKIPDSYKLEYKNDVFFKYYSSDRESMELFGMESKEKLKHRFDAWMVSK